MNKEQQFRTSKKDGKLLLDIFFNKESLRRCPEISRGYFVCFIPLSHGSDDSVDQSTDGVCSSNLLAPFQASQDTNGGVLRDEYGSGRTLPTFGGENTNRAAPLHTKPKRAVGNAP